MAFGVMFLISRNSKRVLPTISVGFNGRGDMSTCLVHVPTEAAAAPSAVPQRGTAVFLATYRKFQITKSTQRAAGGTWTRPGSPCGMPGDSRLPHTWMAGGWPSVPRAPVSHSSSHVSPLPPTSLKAELKNAHRSLSSESASRTQTLQRGG